MFPLIDFLALLFGFGLLAFWEKEGFNDERNQVDKSGTSPWIFVAICVIISLSYGFLYETFEREKLILNRYEIDGFRMLTRAVFRYYRVCLFLLVFVCSILAWLWHKNNEDYSNTNPRTWSSGKIRTYLYYFGLLQIGILVCLHAGVPDLATASEEFNHLNPSDATKAWFELFRRFSLDPPTVLVASFKLSRLVLFFMGLTVFIGIQNDKEIVRISTWLSLIVWLLLGLFILYQFPMFCFVPYLIASFFIFSIWLLFNTGTYLVRIDLAFWKKNKPTLWQFFKQGHYDNSDTVTNYLYRNFKYSSDVRNHLCSFKPNQFLVNKHDEQTEIAEYTGTELLELSLAYLLDSEVNHDVFFAAKAKTLSERLFNKAVIQFKTENELPLDNFKTGYSEFEQYEKLRLTVVENIMDEKLDSNRVFCFMRTEEIAISDAFEDYSFSYKGWPLDKNGPGSISFPLIRREYLYEMGITPTIPSFHFINSFPLLKHVSIKLNDMAEFNPWVFDGLEAGRLDSLTMELSNARISSNLQFKELPNSFQISSNFLPCFIPKGKYSNVLKLKLMGELQTDSQLQEIGYLFALESLDLSHLEISHDLSLSPLAKLEQLKSLRLPIMKVVAPSYEASIGNLFKLLPNCAIH